MAFYKVRCAWIIIFTLFFNVLLASPKKIIITGGPGTGKTTMITKLKEMYYPTFSEAATNVIEHERVLGHERPWENLDQFQQYILDFQLKCLASVPEDAPYAFFDRSIPDGLAYYIHEHKTPIANLVQAAHENRFDVVFYLEYPLTRYGIDAIRHEDESEAKMLHECIRQVYEDMLGYKIVRVPPLPVEERVTFIVDTLHTMFPQQQESVISPVHFNKNVECNVQAPVRVVITGAPCSGKTTLVQYINRYLTQENNITFAEASTEIIKREQAQGNLRPWENREAFQQKILDLQLSYLALIPNNVHYAFFDRGPADGWAYFLHENKKPSVQYEQTIKDTKMDVVFLLDFLQDAYQTNNIRHEGDDEAKMLHERIRQVYEDMLGYKVIRVPVMPVQDRVAFILNTLKEMFPCFAP